MSVQLVCSFLFFVFFSSSLATFSPCAYSTAYTCNDQLDTVSVCMVIFPGSNPNNGSIDPNCQNSTYASTATQCAYTCAACCTTPAFSCQDAPQPNPITCSQLTKAQCQQTSAQALYAQYCPGTCGLCLAGNCSDLIDCTGLSGACLSPDPSTVSFMCTECHRTCGCTACGATAPAVGTPPAGTPTGACGDTSASCPTWISNGFCTSTFYTTAQKQQYCGASCGLCAGK